MDTVQTRRMAPPERRILHRLKRQLSNQVNSRHARIILLSSGRVCNRQIAELVDCTPQWVRRIIHRFNDGGLDAVTWYPYFHASATPRQFTADVVEEIARVALSPPRALIGMNQWSVAKLRAYLVEQRIVGSISLEWLRFLLHRHGIRWRRTKTWKVSKDPEFAAKYRRIRRLYGRRPSGGRRICLDEFGPLNIKPRHGQCLAGEGKKVERLPATYRRVKGVRHFLAAYDLETNCLFGIFTARKTAVEFLQFLQWLRRRYRSGEKLHLIMDNYATHLEAGVVRWAREHNIRMYYTPTGASWLNRIECQLTEMKKFALETSHFQSHEEQQQAIESFLLWRNRKRTISIEPWYKFKETRCAA